MKVTTQCIICKEKFEVDATDSNSIQLVCDKCQNIQKKRLEHPVVKDLMGFRANRAAMGKTLDMITSLIPRKPTTEETSKIVKSQLAGDSLDETLKKLGFDKKELMEKLDVFDMLEILSKMH